MDYPETETVIRLLLGAAERAGKESNAQHPEDIAIAMSFAIENAHGVILDCYNEFKEK